MSSPRSSVRRMRCNMNVLEERFPLARRDLQAPHAPACHRKVSGARPERVVVSSDGYAFDNRCTLEEMAALDGCARHSRRRPDTPMPSSGATAWGCAACAT